MRNFLIVIVGVLLVNAFLLYSGGFEYIKKQFEPTPRPAEIETYVINTFKQTLEAEVRKKLGTPIEGYEPHMFLEIFPGIAETDFDGVEASIGHYALVNGRLEHQMDYTQLIHSAAKAISWGGMETLYRNIATRIGVDIQNGGTLTVIMGAVTSQPQ